MSGRHAAAAELEGYVLGALDPARVEAFEAHAAACGSCAAALAREARLELTFERVADRIANPSTRGARSSRAAAYGTACLAAMAAAALLWIGHAPPSASAASGDGTTATADRRAMDDGAILDVRADVLDGG